LLALLALPCVARADTMGEIPVGRTGVTGTIVAEGETQTWTVQLKAGLDYAFAATSDDLEGPVATLAGAGGAALCTAWVADAGGYTGGCSFQAPYSGLYTVTAVNSGEGSLPARYVLWVTRDCRADARTQCRVAVGHTHPIMLFDYDSDWDWIAANLVAGRRYRIAAKTGGDFFSMDLGLRAPDGTRLRIVTGTSVSFTYTPARSGTYYIETINESEDYRQDYSLSLTRVR